MNKVVIQVEVDGKPLLVAEPTEIRIESHRAEKTGKFYHDIRWTSGEENLDELAHLKANTRGVVWEERIVWHSTLLGIPTEEEITRWVDSGYIPLLQERLHTGKRVTREFDLSLYPTGYDEGDLRHWCEENPYWALSAGPRVVGGAR